MTAISVTNAATLATALAEAVGGDRIELAPGHYGDLSFEPQYMSDVVIASVDRGNPAIFGRLDMDGAEHVVFDGIYFKYVASDPGSTLPFVVSNSNFIAFMNCTFEGDLIANDGYGKGKGLQTYGCWDLVVEHCLFFNWMKAVAFSSGGRLTIRANNIHSCNNDAINFTANDGVLVEYNWIHDFLTTSTHNDMIQAWNPDINKPLKNVIIRFNFFDGGTGGRTQTIFMRNGKAELDPTNLDVYYQNILIEDNVLFQAHSHGITVGETVGLTIRRNTLLRNKNTLGDVHHAPQIKTYGVSQQLVVEMNIDYKNYGGSQFVAQDDDPNGENYYGVLFVNPFVAGATLADLRAVSGGEIETLGVGAEMTRSDIDITLAAGPQEPDTQPPIEPPVISPEVQSALDALQSQIDTNLGRLTTLEDAHNALVSDVDAKFAGIAAAAGGT